MALTEKLTKPASLVANAMRGGRLPAGKQPWFTPQQAGFPYLLDLPRLTSTCSSPCTSPSLRASSVMRHVSQSSLPGGRLGQQRPVHARRSKRQCSAAKPPSSPPAAVGARKGWRGHEPQNHGRIGKGEAASASNGPEEVRICPLFRSSRASPPAPGPRRPVLTT